MNVRIRESTKEDFDELWRIDQLCFQAGISYTRRELAWYMNMRGAFTLTGEVQDKPRSRWRIAGFVVGQQPRPRIGHIVTIDVLPDARRTGLGTRLMSEVQARLQEDGCETIVLEAAVDNVSAIKFYKRLGYYVIKTIPRYYLDKIDALVMSKDLRTADSSTKS